MSALTFKNNVPKIKSNGGVSTSAQHMLSKQVWVSALELRGVGLKT